MRRAISSAASIAAGFLASILIILFSGDDFGNAVRGFFYGPISSPFFLGGLLNTASLLTVAGAGMALAFRAGFFNIGGEGQVYLAGLVAALVAASFSPAPGLEALSAKIAVALVAFSVGAALAAVAGTLRAFFDVPELITTFLISGAVVPIVDFLISGPFRDSSGYLLATTPIDENLTMTTLLPPSSFSTVVVAAGIVILISVLVLWRTRLGFAWRLMGYNSLFARLSGLPTTGLTIAALATTGGLYGLTGGLTVLGSSHMAAQGFTAGYGWNGITVALIAANRPALVPAAALLLAYLDAGARTAVLQSDLAIQFGSVAQGVVLLLCTVDFLAARRKAAR